MPLFFIGDETGSVMASLLKVLRWLLRIALFVLLFGLAVKNSEVMTLHFFFGIDWAVPVAVVLLVTFAAGVMIGMAAAWGTIWRRRKQRPAESQG